MKPQNQEPVVLELPGILVSAKQLLSKCQTNEDGAHMLKILTEVAIKEQDFLSAAQYRDANRTLRALPPQGTMSVSCKLS